MARTSRRPRPAPTDLDRRVVARLHSTLPTTARHTVDAVVAEVEEYADPLRGQLGQNITEAVELALGTFLRVVNGSADTAAPDALQAALDGAYALGRGEARAGRTMAALLSAYRVGARVAWSDWGSVAVDAGTSPDRLVGFADRVFAYIDQLSAASVAGHTDELATSGRVREQYLERLGVALLGSAPVEELNQRSERADWEPPDTLTAVLITASRTRSMAASLDRRTLVLSADVVGADLPADISVLLVPDAGPKRSALRALLRDDPAIIGPTRPWTKVASSYRRTLRAHARHGLSVEALDTEGVLAELVLTADTDALADLRDQVLAPLAGLSGASRDRLVTTLLAWILHQGRRDEVAQQLHVHPQTVRYRMTQLRAAYGDRLSDPATVRDLVLALSAEPLP